MVIIKTCVAFREFRHEARSATITTFEHPQPGTRQSDERESWRPNS